MSFLVKGGGVTALSALTIDADKDWAAMGISNIKELAAGMVIGDVLVFDGTRLVVIHPGTATHVLTSAGPGDLPAYAPGGSYFDRYFPAILGPVTAALAIVAPDVTEDNTISPTTNLSSQLAPTFASEPTVAAAAAVVAPDVTEDNTIAPATARTYVVMDVMGGALAEDGGVQTDQTAAANNETTNDMTLLPATPALNDAYLFGYAAGTFPAIHLRIDTVGNGVWVLTWEYWNGAWVALAGVVDNTNNFMPSAAGRYEVSWTVPGDWVAHAESGLNLFWVRARVSNYTSRVTAPKGGRCYIETASG